MHQPHLFVRVGVLASSLALVSGLIAYRTGYLSPPQRLVLEQPVDPLFLSAIEGGVPLPPSDDELAEIGNANVTQQEMNGLEPDQGTAQSPWIAADNSHSKNMTVQNSLVASTAGATDSKTAPPVQSRIESVQSQRPAVISSSKSIVLLEAKPALQKAKEALVAEEKSYEAKMFQAAKLAFSERDRNRDGRLSQDELGEKTWKKLQEQKLVENGSVDVNGFSKVFIQLADQ